MAVPAAAEAGTHDGRPDSLSVPVMDRRIVSADHRVRATGRHEEAGKSRPSGPATTSRSAGQKRGGHPGHDQGRRLSIPQVVAPHLFRSAARHRARDPSINDAIRFFGNRRAGDLRGVMRDPRLTTTEARHINSTSSYGGDIHASRSDVIDRTRVILWSRRILSSSATRRLSMRLVVATKTARKDREFKPRREENFSCQRCKHCRNRRIMLCLCIRRCGCGPRKAEPGRP